MNLFLNVYGVGPIRANQWYNLGYRQLEDIQEEHCTRAQLIGLKHYYHLKERIPRAEIDTFKQILRYWLNKANESYQKDLVQGDLIQRDLAQEDLAQGGSISGGSGPVISSLICGSYRRGHKTSGDIDVLIFHRFKDDQNILDYVLRCPCPDGKLLFTEYLSKGITNFNGICNIFGTFRRVDIKIFRPAHSAFPALYFTGSKEHNIMMRNRGIELGFRLNEKGLINIRSGVTIQLKTEHEIFDFLGLEFKPPTERK